MAFRTIAYVDGFNLYYGMREKGWRHCYWLDVAALAQGLLRPDQTLGAVKYFTALVSSTPRDPTKNRRQITYIEALQTRPAVEVFYGHYLSKQVTCRNCGAAWETHEEKMTDVNIAIEMLNDAYQDRFDTALLISADSDLRAPYRLSGRSSPRNGSSPPSRRRGVPTNSARQPTEASPLDARSSSTRSSPRQ